ncbi:MAG TPA: transporter substrate-binding domain-containing protein, partial [Patescibacteria group bacterium]|nr:transporter substrate-binding domain-containing protein [Patescibacteria group bacterium]
VYTDTDLVLLYENFDDATDALLTGKADAIFTDLTNAKGTVDEHKDLKIASDPFTSEFYGVVFRKGETDLVQRVNEVLNLLRQRGVEVFLKQKWLE